MGFPSQSVSVHNSLSSGGREVLRYKSKSTSQTARIQPDMQRYAPRIPINVFAKESRRLRPMAARPGTHGVWPNSTAKSAKVVKVVKVVKRA